MGRGWVWAIAGAGALAAASAAAPQSNVETKRYDTGEVYEGQFKEGRQHGAGTLVRPDGFRYTGEFVDGWIQGQGVADGQRGRGRCCWRQIQWTRLGDVADGEMNTRQCGEFGVVPG